MRTLLSVILLFSFIGIFSQDQKIDSLESLLNSAKEDTLKDRLRIQLLDVLEGDEKIKMIDLLQKRSESVLNELKENSKNSLIYKRYLGTCYYHRGMEFDKALKNEKAVTNYRKAINFFREIKDEKTCADIHQYIGKVYQDMGRIKESIAHLDTALHIFEKYGQNEDASNALNFLAVSYSQTGNKESATKIYLRNLDLQRKIGYKKGEANTLINLGGMFFKDGNLEKAEDYCRHGLILSEENGFYKGVNEGLNNLALIHFRQKKIPESLSELEKVISLARQTKDMRSEMKAYITRAKIYDSQNKISLLKKDAEKAYELSLKINFLNLLTEATRWMYIANKKSGNTEQALRYYEIFIRNKDSLTSADNKKASMRSQIKYEYEKQAAADSVAHAKESEIKNAELAKQKAELSAKKNQQYALFSGLGLVMIFAGFMYNRFKVTQKQKGIIEVQKAEVEMQKQLVEEKQKEMLDSIHYAKRIQLAQIPSEKKIETSLSRLKK